MSNVVKPQNYMPMKQNDITQILMSDPSKDSVLGTSTNNEIKKNIISMLFPLVIWNGQCILVSFGTVYMYTKMYADYVFYNYY